MVKLSISPAIISLTVIILRSLCFFGPDGCRVILAVILFPSADADERFAGRPPGARALRHRWPRRSCGVTVPQPRPRTLDPHDGASGRVRTGDGSGHRLSSRPTRKQSVGTPAPTDVVAQTHQSSSRGQGRRQPDCAGDCPADPGRSRGPADATRLRRPQRRPPVGATQLRLPAATACPRRSRRPDWPFRPSHKRWPSVAASSLSRCWDRRDCRSDQHRDTTRWSGRCRSG